jgi:hypothetical protein
MEVLLIAALVVVAVFMFWLVHKSGQWHSWMMQATKEAQFNNRLLMSLAVLGCVGFWWFMSSP